MQNGYGKNINFKIAFTGMMLGLVILGQFLEQFMPFTEFMKINLSLVFIMATIYVAGFGWAFLLLLLRFAIGPSVDSLGYTDMGMWSHFTLFLFGIMFMLTFFFFERKVFRNKSEKVKLFLSSITSISIVSVIGILLNGLLITPVFYTFFGQDGISQEASHATYKTIKEFYFDIPNYWTGISVVYGVGNIIKFTIISILFISIWKIIGSRIKK